MTDSPEDSPFIDFKPHDFLRDSQYSDNNLLTSTIMATPKQKTVELFLSPMIEATQEEDSGELFNQAFQSTFEQYLQSNNITLQDASLLISKRHTEDILELATHPIGNFNLQQLIQHNTLEYLLSLETNIYSLALHPQGTRVIQKIIEIIPFSLRKFITFELQSHVTALIFSPNGNHCIGKIFDFFDPLSAKFAIQECISSFMQVSTHQHGCCLFQKAINISDDLFPEIFALTQTNAVQMVENQYANFVFQCVLESPQIAQNNLKIDDLITPCLPFARQFCRKKQSSHVVEKFVTLATGEILANLVDFLTENSIDLAGICCDKFGNYVVQKILQKGFGKERIRKIRGELAGNQYARFIIMMID